MKKILLTLFLFQLVLAPLLTPKLEKILIGVVAVK